MGTEIREFRDYMQWLTKGYVPSQHKLSSLIKSGFVFPDGVRTCKGSEEAKPEDKFHPSLFPGFVPGKIVDGTFCPINAETDLTFEVFKNKLKNSLDNSDNNPQDGPQLLPHQHQVDPHTFQSEEPTTIANNIDNYQAL